MDNLLFESKQPMSSETPRQLRHALAPIIKVYVPDETIRYRIQLCLSEAITNLILHTQTQLGMLTLRFGSNVQGWWLDIFDNTSPWDPTKRLDDELLSHFKTIEHGRGIALLHTQSDNISYHSGENTSPNKLRLVWHFPKQHKQYTILLVEDNACLRRLYRSYLTSHFNVLTASDGHEALQRLSTNRVDLVLSDIKMPSMNGLSLRKNINQQPSNELIPFIFLTAEEDDFIQEQAVELGIDDYLLKPVDSPQLLKIIRRVLGRSNQVHTQLTERITERLDKQITASLKPRLPNKSHGWHCAVASRNTGSGGGDLLLHNHNDDALQVVLTDIMGHDDSAKFFAHACGGYIHGLMQSMALDTNPAQLLEQLSHFVAEDSILSQVTLTCCSVHLSSGGIVQVASAGHPAPLLISSEQIIPLPTEGILLGLLPDTQYQSTQINVKQGERLALYTDGLFESASNNHDREKLASSITATLHKTRDMPITESIKQVMALFDQLTGSQPTDDALLILLEPE